MPIDKMSATYTIEGEGSNTDYTINRLEENGKEAIITSSYSVDPDSGSSISVITWWDHGTAVGSSVMIDDRVGELSGGYISKMGEAMQPITIVGGGGGKMPMDMPDFFDM
ncbi:MULTISPECIES: hypothetical protein [unclassified Duganella]|uniref:hypothetical protein n=1 Tax=unclassified Duganella TaxID=2636909 RepID=UPI000873BEA0|nr:MULTISPECIES: hypothetical protein [unclassified Duganella]OEZ62818.1 hypothetical protein DUGA6_16050 [Duganella sp. HH105]OFA02070.1 hypothetical protein DUGA2_39960 [Duganella sp. HH101]